MELQRTSHDASPAALPVGLRVLWAITAGEESRRFHSAPQLLTALCQRLPADKVVVDRVYLISSTRNTPMNLEANEEEYTRLLTVHLERQWRGFSLPSAQPVQFLTSQGFTQRGRSRSLLQHASLQKSDLIVVSQHRRGRFARFGRVGLPEALLSHSSIPLLVASPRMPPVHALEPVIFATDLSTSSHQALPKVIRLAANLGSRLVLYHQLRGARSRGVREACLEAWAAEAHAQGVSTEIKIDDRPGPASEAILTCARGFLPSSPLLAMVSHVKRWARPLRGSVTRTVMRQTNFPTWILRAGAVANCAEA